MQYDLVEVVQVPHLGHAHSGIGVVRCQLLCVREYTFTASVFESIPSVQKGHQTSQNQRCVGRLKVWLVEYCHI